MDKKNKLFSLFSQAQKIPLNEKFLRSFRDNLLNYLKVNPKDEPAAKVALADFSFRFIRTAAGLAALFIIIAGGASALAAKKSLPGDLLYPVKITVEKLRAELVPAGQSKVDFRIQQAYDRIGEIKKLQAETAEKIDPSLLEETSWQFSAHIKDALSQTRALQQEGLMKEADEIHDKLDLSLKIYEQIIKMKPAAEPLLVEHGRKNQNGQRYEVKDAQEELKKDQAETRKKEPASGSNQNLIQEKINSAAKDGQAVEKLIKDNQNRLLNDIASKSEDQLAKTKDELKRAQEKFNKGDFHNAADEVNDATDSLKQSKALIETALIIKEERLKEILPQIDAILQEKPEKQDNRGKNKDNGRDRGNSGSNYGDN
ncbi:MAG: hypothetical protein HYV53_02235 [Parcubacteria group bacterium]|nr:hypothetical protein [Parcubacteria group bacterium]